MSFILNSCLDIFDMRLRSTATNPKSVTLDQDLGLLHAVDERLAAYGWLTNTNIKFIIIVDMLGRPAAEDEEQRKGMPPPVVGLRDAELKVAFRAVQTAYIGLLMNPFYTPEMRTPMQIANSAGAGRMGARIKSNKFSNELDRIGRVWYPGVATL